MMCELRGEAGVPLDRYVLRRDMCKRRSDEREKIRSILDERFEKLDVDGK